MSINNREQAARRAEASKTNIPNMCQGWTRNMFNAPSVGDVDHDRDADAVDGWKSEPVSARHHDRTPPRGVPVAWSGGSNGHGHRAVSLGNGKIRSTDAGGSGRVATVDLGWVERNWGMNYLGWSETISGHKIPIPEKTRGALVDAALLRLRKARSNTNSPRRKRIIQASIDKLMKLKPYYKI